MSLFWHLTNRRWNYNELQLQCVTSFGSHRRNTDRSLKVSISSYRHRSDLVRCGNGSGETTVSRESKARRTSVTHLQLYLRKTQPCIADVLHLDAERSRQTANVGITSSKCQAAAVMVAVIYIQGGPEKNAQSLMHRHFATYSALRLPTWDDQAELTWVAGYIPR